MIRKSGNKKLFLLFILLAVMAGVVYILDRRKGERTFRDELFTVDSAKVTTLRIYPKGTGSDPLVLEKTGNRWEVVAKGKKHPADSSAVSNLLASLRDIKPTRVAASDPSGWPALEMTDSLSRRVVVEQSGKVTADFRLGKISFIQGSRMQARGRNQGFSALSHIRVPGDDDVYVVDGFLAVLFSDQPSHYRNRVICKADKNLLTRLTFVYPGDSSFVLARAEKGWTVNGRPADSAKTQSYLNSLTTLSDSEFADDETIPVTFPYTLKIEGNGIAPVTLTGAIDPLKKKYFLRSDANPSATFGSAGPRVFSLVFAPKSRF